ncbi:unnamed protein product, partial [Laminaria digitata]
GGNHEGGAGTDVTPRDEENETFVPEPVSGPVPGLGPRPILEPVSGPVPGLGPRPFARERGSGKGGRGEDMEAFSGAAAGAESRVSDGEEEEVVEDKLPPMLASLERAALTVKDPQGRCVRFLQVQDGPGPQLPSQRQHEPPPPPPPPQQQQQQLSPPPPTRRQLPPRPPRSGEVRRGAAPGDLSRRRARDLPPRVPPRLPE